MSNTNAWLIQPRALLDGRLAVRASAETSSYGLRYFPVVLVTMYTQPITSTVSRKASIFLSSVFRSPTMCICIIVKTRYRHDLATAFEELSLGQGISLDSCWFRVVTHENWLFSSQGSALRDKLKDSNGMVSFSRSISRLAIRVTI